MTHNAAPQHRTVARAWRAAAAAFHWQGAARLKRAGRRTGDWEGKGEGSLCVLKVLLSSKESFWDLC